MNAHKVLLVSLSFVASGTALAAGNTPPEVARYLKKQGPVIEHQIFRSNEGKQLVVRFCVDENLKGGENEGASNPANVHCEVALFNKSKTWVFANRLSIGQGSISGFKDGKVWGESLGYSPADALCCPSQKEQLVFSTEGGRLVLLTK